MAKFRNRLSDFIYDYQMPICVAFALLGFLVSIVILNPTYETTKDSKKNTPYGEIIIDNKTKLVLELLEKRSAGLAKAIIEAKASTTSKPIPTGPILAAIEKRIGVLQKVLRKTKDEITGLEFGSTGNNLTYYKTYIFPDRRALLNTLNLDSWTRNPEQIKQVEAQIIDTSTVLGQPIMETTCLKLKLNKRPFLISFITDYPEFGIWIILTIAQMMLWFLLFPLLTGNIKDLKLKLGQYYSITTDSILKNLIVPAAFVALFVLVFYRILADNTVIYDNYFFSGFNERFFYYALVGYALAIYCFGTFLTLIRQVTDMDEKARIRNLDRKNSTLNDKYLALKEAFDNSFLASAVVLSFLVLWVGVTINAVNNTEAIKFYGTVSGKPLIPQDFIYLMGLLHTMVLLSFYIPAKLKFNSISLTKQEDAATANSTPTRKIFRLLAENLGTLLVTTSPLIASLIQKLLETDPTM
jgi:hypothetical protein